MKRTLDKPENTLGKGTRARGKRILKIRGMARGVAKIDESISALRRSRIKRVLLGR